MKIRFNFFDGNRLVVDFPSNDILEVIVHPVFKENVSKSDFWEDLNENGLSYLEQLKADGKIRYTYQELKEMGEI